VQISKIYEGLKDQAGLLTGLEKQVSDLITTNKQNFQDSDCLKLITNRLTYFNNQQRCFNVLFEAVTDLKIMNEYLLLETEAQLREEAEKV